MDIITLENSALRLEFAHETGALVGLSAKETGWEVLNRRHLGLSFQLLLPLPRRRNNPVYGEKQKVSTVEVAADGQSVNFAWDRVHSAYGGDHPIRLELAVALAGEQATFALSIDNKSENVVEVVYCPYFGDVQRPPAADSFEAFHYGYAEAERRSLYPTFDNTLGYYGFDYPVQYGPDSWRSGAPAVPYILLRSAKQGLYVGINEPSAELVAWHNELRPGYDSAIDSRVPTSSSISGLDVATRFRRDSPAIYSAGRIALADANCRSALSGQLAAGRGCLQELARQLDDDAGSPGLGARAAFLVATSYQLARR